MWGDFLSFPDWPKAVKRRGENDTGAEECEGVKTWQGEWFGEEGEQRDAYGGGSPDPPERGLVSGRHSSVNYSSCSGEEGQNSSPAPFSPYFHVSLWGWERWAICYKCMMNFIKYSQLLLKSLEICKIEPNMPRTDLTRRAEMWNLPEIKSSAGIQGLYESLSFFFPSAEHDFIEIMTVTCFINVLFRQAS